MPAACMLKYIFQKNVYTFFLEIQVNNRNLHDLINLDFLV